MQEFFISIDTEITKIESQLPSIIYSYLTADMPSNKVLLRTHDELLTQLMFKLDNQQQIDKNMRKERIMKIQNIQKVIDRIIELDNKVAISLEQLTAINELLKVKNEEIHTIKKENSTIKEILMSIYNQIESVFMN